MSWQKYYHETLQKYPDFATVKQVMEICNITKRQHIDIFIQETLIIKWTSE